MGFEDSMHANRYISVFISVYVYCCDKLLYYLVSWHLEEVFWWPFNFSNNLKTFVPYFMSHCCLGSKHYLKIRDWHMKVLFISVVNIKVKALDSCRNLLNSSPWIHPTNITKKIEVFAQ